MIIIGKFKEIYNDNSLPSINDFISNKTISNKSKILAYLKNAKKSSCSPGIVNDVITGQPINSELCCYSDGVFAWRSDIIYYFDKYNLILDNDFIKHILKK